MKKMNFASEDSDIPLAVGDLACLIVVSGQRFIGVVVSVTMLEETRFIGGSVVPIRRRQEILLATGQGVVMLKSAMIFSFKRL